VSTDHRVERERGLKPNVDKGEGGCKIKNYIFADVLYCWSLVMSNISVY